MQVHGVSYLVLDLKHLLSYLVAFLTDAFIDCVHPVLGQIHIGCRESLLLGGRHGFLSFLLNDGVGPTFHGADDDGIVLTIAVGFGQCGLCREGTERSGCIARPPGARPARN
jgi:hypothetical protein